MADGLERTPARLFLLFDGAGFVRYNLADMAQASHAMVSAREKEYSDDGPATR